jgi:hypothetical protein
VHIILEENEFDDEYEMPETKICHRCQKEVDPENGGGFDCDGYFLCLNCLYNVRT